MKPYALALSLTLWLAACSGDSVPPVDGPDVVGDAEAPELPEDVMENIEMHLWPANAAPRQGQKPLLSIRASSVTGSAAEGGEWAFRDAIAVAPAQEAGQAEIRFKAARGSFDEGRGAVLEDSVTAYMNDMTIQLQDIIWELGTDAGADAKGGQAYSNHPLTIDSPTQKLEASSLRLDPETSNFELTDVSGEIHFGGMTP
jgi:hypothetical protein